MENNLSATHRSTESPLIKELDDLFDVIPLEPLMERLVRHRRGPKGYPAESLFRIFVASYYLNHDSISDTVRALQDNATLADWCHVLPWQIPSRSTLSRFFKKLSENANALADTLAELTNQLHARLPEFGQLIAIDSTTIRTHSNPDRKPATDPEASWTAKGYRVGSNQKQWSFGMKLHLAVDAVYELPISMHVTTGKGADSLNLSPLLEDAASRFDWFNPVTVAADKGYDALHIYKTIIEGYKAAPIIPIRMMRPGAKKRRRNAGYRTDIDRESKEWKKLYAGRTSVERCFGRCKQTRRLERHCYRGLAKITTHCLLSVLTLQAKALAQVETTGGLRDCLRKVA